MSKNPEESIPVPGMDIGTGFADPVVRERFLAANAPESDGGHVDSGKGSDNASLLLKLSAGTGGGLALWTSLFG